MSTDSSAAFLGRVERGIAAAVQADGLGEAVLAPAAAHLCLGTGAKRMRPQLVRLLAEALGVGDEPAENVAVAAELIHAASLLHDDVVDQGQTRRGRTTVNATWGNAVAVLTGDWLLCGALARLRNHPQVVTAASVECVAMMSRAAIAEIQARGDLDLGEAGWRAIAEGKTGALLGFCGEALAYTADRAELVAPLRRFGRHLGAAFQLADDLADLFALQTGKDRFSDLKNRNPSLPLLRAAADDASLRRRIDAAWAWPSVSEAAARELGEAVLASSAPADCAAQLDIELKTAAASLGPLREAVWEPLREWAAPLCAAVPDSPAGAPFPAPLRGAR